jgi:hypothetical protein
MIPKSAVKAFSELLSNVDDLGLNKMFKEASPPPKPRPKRPGPQGNRALRDFERRKAKEAGLPQLNRQEKGELEARQPRIEYTRNPKRPDHRRENKDLRQRPLDKPRDFYAEKATKKKEGPVMSKEQFEETGAPDVEYPQNHHILGLDQMDEVFQNSTARENKWIQKKVEEQTGLTFGDTEGNSVWLQLQHHIGKDGLHEFLRKNGLDKLNISSNASKEKKFNAIMKMIKALIDNGYFDEMVSRTYMPKTGKLKVNKKGQMTSQGGITGMTSIIP